MTITVRPFVSIASHTIADNMAIIESIIVTPRFDYSNSNRQFFLDSSINSPRHRLMVLLLSNHRGGMLSFAVSGYT
jgi:hypothetical protein